MTDQLPLLGAVSAAIVVAESRCFGDNGHPLTYEEYADIAVETTLNHIYFRVQQRLRTGCPAGHSLDQPISCDLCDEVRSQNTVLQAVLRDVKAAGGALVYDASNRPVKDIDEGHNHFTRDVKPPGQCPACDRLRG